MNMKVETRTTAAGCLTGHVFEGDFAASLSYEEIKLQVGLEGSFFECIFLKWHNRCVHPIAEEAGSG